MGKKLFAALLCVGLLFSPAFLHAQASLEVPASGSFVSGLGYVAGWKCTAGTITFTIDNGPPGALVYGSARADTKSICKDIGNNGFIAQFNWNLLSSAQHTIRVFDNGSKFAEATFTVSTLGTEFFSGAGATCNTSIADKAVALSWQKNQQNFIITGVSKNGPFSGSYGVDATKSSDTCNISQTKIVDTLDITQNGSAITGIFQSAPGVSYAGTVENSGKFSLTQDDPLPGTSAECHFEVFSSVSGNFNIGSITIVISRRKVSGVCPSNVACDAYFNGLLTKLDEEESGAAQSSTLGDDKGASVENLFEELLD